ncbi:nucleotide disphospho-sugar-binding domain-containing protein [Spirillospora sp. NPDC029432]|uniref:nucleotide disphospho-sugar-binding domain-containing protein n=1 Tax=Spirillospora sp. NPDC029432 TaxID=3154599 RepID=UPI0034524C5D
MKVLFVTTGSHVTVYATAPLTTAAQNAGHEVLLATNEPLIEAVEAIGAPAVSIMPETIRHFMTAGDAQDAPGGPMDAREEMLTTGRGLARMASAALEALLDLAEDWRPDLIVGSSMSYAAGLLATRLKVPFVRHAEYFQIPAAEIDPGAEQGLRPELDRLGLEGLPEPDLYIDVCPPSLRPPGGPEVRPMRFIPRNPQRRLEPWMYARPKDRPRVLITSGTHFRMLSGESMRYLVDRLTLAGAEVLITAPKGAAEELGAGLGDVRVGWIPLDVVAPTCDLAVNHGGATTAMTIMTAGVPQLIIPPNTHTRLIARSLADCGAALTVPPRQERDGSASDREPAEEIAAGCREILSTPRYTRRAQALAKEIATLPTPAEVVRTLETLVTA